MVAGTSRRLLALVVAVAALTGCKPTETPVSAGGSSATTAAASQAAPVPSAKAASLCELIIDINTSAEGGVSADFGRDG